MKRYRVASAARDDLKRISHYIAIERESPQSAKRLREQFLEDFRRLAHHPFLGQACPEFGENLRIWPVGNYIVLYVPQENGIDIVQVAHGARDLPAIVRTPPSS
jgi:toxin ParE1/3/4